MVTFFVMWNLIENINEDLCVLKGDSKMIVVLDIQKLLIWRFPEMEKFVTKMDIIFPSRSLENINDSRIAREKRKVMEMWFQKSNSQKINFLAAQTIIFVIENNYYSKTSEPSKSQ